MALIQCRIIVAGEATGEALVTNEPFSFWGGYDHKSGVITDVRHPLRGQTASGRVLCVPFTKGSSTTANVMLQAIKSETAPCAVVTVSTDAFLALASIVADELWSKAVPIVAIEEAQFAKLKTGMRLRVNKDVLEINEPC